MNPFKRRDLEQNIATFCIVILFHAQVNAPNTWSGIHVIFFMTIQFTLNDQISELGFVKFYFQNPFKPPWLFVNMPISYII